MATKTRRNPSIGSVSSGTLKTDDLIHAFEDELRSQGRSCPVRRALVNDYLTDPDEAGEDEIDAAQDYLERLQDRLERYAPAFMFFGSHEGDGADFGYWFDRTSFEDAVVDGEVLKVSDLPESFGSIRKEYPEAEYIAVVTDHGNVSLYTKTGREVWSIV